MTSKARKIILIGAGYRLHRAPSAPPQNPGRRSPPGPESQARGRPQTRRAPAAHARLAPVWLPVLSFGTAIRAERN